MKKENLMMIVAFCLIFTILLVLLALTRNYVPNNSQIKEPSINDIDIDKEIITNNDVNTNSESNQNLNQLPLSKVIRYIEKPKMQTEQDNDESNNEADEYGDLMFANNDESDIYRGTQFSPGYGCNPTTCNSNCKLVNFIEGKCLNDICFCLNEKINNPCVDNSCASSCPSGEGSCIGNRCSCATSYDQISCRSYGNTSVREYGNVLFYTTPIENNYELRTENYCIGNILMKFNCKDDFLKLETEELIEKEELETSLLFYEEIDCRDLYGCQEQLKVGMCVESQCVCKYEISKEFVQNAITNFLMNPATRLTNADLSFLTEAHLNPASIDSLEEVKLGKLINLINQEIEDSKLQINYKLLY
jgi:hypothetical protein